MSRINHRLRVARQRRFWSIANASMVVGVSVVTYHQWELGKKNPSLEGLRALCKAFNMPPEALGYPIYPSPEQYQNYSDWRIKYVPLHIL